MRKPLQNRLEIVRQLIRPPEKRAPYHVVFRAIDGTIEIDRQPATEAQLLEIEADPYITVIEFAPQTDPP